MTDQRQLSELNSDERGRYARHLTLPELGLAGQTRLKAPPCSVSALEGSVRRFSCISRLQGSDASASWTMTGWISVIFSAK